MGTTIEVRLPNVSKWVKPTATMAGENRPPFAYVVLAMDKSQGRWCPFIDGSVLCDPPPEKIAPATALFVNSQAAFDIEVVSPVADKRPLLLLLYEKSEGTGAGFGGHLIEMSKKFVSLVRIIANIETADLGRTQDLLPLAPAKIRAFLASNRIADGDLLT